MNIINTLIQIAFIFFATLVFKNLGILKNVEGKDIYTTLIPIIAIIIANLVTRSRLLIGYLIKLKYFFSEEPIKWEVRGLFETKENRDSSFMNLYEVIEKKLSQNYKLIKCDIKNSQRILLSIDCVRLEILNITNASDNTYQLDLNFSSESPIKTFNRKHVEKMITPIFDYLNGSYNGIKFEATANKQIIPIDKLYEFDSTMEIIDYCINLKTKNKKSNLSISKEFGFNCVSNNWNDCLYYINKYIYT